MYIHPVLLHAIINSRITELFKSENDMTLFPPVLTLNSHSLTHLNSGKYQLK